MPDAFHGLLEFSILASARDPFDPMEKAFHELGREKLAETEHRTAATGRCVHAYGLQTGLLAMSHVWREADGQDSFVIATKGAPEAIADLCHLGAADRAALVRSMEVMAAEGLRVLGVARASSRGIYWPSSQHDFSLRVSRAWPGLPTRCGRACPRR